MDDGRSMFHPPLRITELGLGLLDRLVHPLFLCQN
jgi:hypothetical protein